MRQQHPSGLAVTHPTPAVPGSTAASAQSRSAAVDAVRVLGIVAIVGGHTWAEEDTLRPFIASWRVPTFFLLSGYLWCFRRGLVEDIARRGRALMVPYFTWLAIIGVPWALWAWQEHGLNPVRSAVGLLYGSQLGRPFSAFWFVAALFLAGVVVRAGQQLGAAFIWFVAGAGLMVSYLAGSSVATVPYSAAVAGGCAFFVLIGQQFKLRRALITRPGVTGGLLVGLGGVLIISHAATGFDIKYGDFGRPVISLAAAICVGLGIILLAERLVPALSTSTEAAISRFGSVGLGVLLAHAALLWVTDSRLGWPLPLCFGIALTLPWALGLALAGTRLSPWLLGRPKTLGRGTEQSGADYATVSPRKAATPSVDERPT